jgi:hypothetical protein
MHPSGSDSAAAENRLYVVAVWIENEGSVIARWIAFGGIAEIRATVIGPTGLQGSRVEGVDGGAIFGYEGRVLFHAMRMESVNPENRVIDAIADAIGPIVIRKLHDPPQSEGAQSHIVKGSGSRDVRDTDSSMINHDKPLP